MFYFVSYEKERNDASHYASYKKTLKCRKILTSKSMTFRILFLCISGYGPGWEEEAGFIRFILVLISDVQQITEVFFTHFSNLFITPWER